jgi:peptide/nickel transport system permease protein
MGEILLQPESPARPEPQELAPGEHRSRRPRPLLDIIIKRTGIGILTLWFVSILVFAATQVLPGNAAYAVLQNTATPARLHALERQLHLNRPAVVQYWTWLTGLLHGNLGISLASQVPVSSLIGSRIENSAVLVVLAGLIGTFIGVSLGVLAAAKRDSWLDHLLSVISLAVTALPEFVVAVIGVVLFASLVWHVLPAVSVFAPGTPPWSNPSELVLPVATLVVVIVPYVFRMMRAAMIDALESDYVEMARLKGLPRWRVLVVHALPNGIAPTIQVIGLTFLYLAGGVVVVEYVFNYPGIGQELVSAVSDRDIPVIQFIVLILAAFYVAVNILTDVVSLAVTPRRRLPRS